MKAMTITKLTAAVVGGLILNACGGGCDSDGVCDDTSYYDDSSDNGGTTDADTTTWTLAVTVIGNGSVSSKSGAGLIDNCTAAGGKNCSDTFDDNDVITVTATPAAGYAFTTWGEGGACSGTNPTVKFTIGRDTKCTATFAAVGNSKGGDPMIVGTALGRLVPIKCDNYAVTDGIASGTASSRGYVLYTVGANGTINTTTNDFLYSGSNCTGNRTFLKPENTLTADSAMTFQLIETYNGYTLNRYQNQPLYAVIDPYQVTYITTPAGSICQYSHTQDYSAERLVDPLESNGGIENQGTSCGTWENLGGGQFQP
jgi:hypothetical protein